MIPFDMLLEVWKGAGVGGGQGQGQGEYIVHFQQTIAPWVGFYSIVFINSSYVSICHLLTTEASTMIFPINYHMLPSHPSICWCPCTNMTMPPTLTEAEYAYQLRKQIIPLMMEPRFQPSGWLGIIVGTKLWMDFRDVRNLEAGTSHLVRELGKAGKSQGTFI